MSLSQRSLIVQPAPLIMIAPRPNSARVCKSGRHPGAAAKDILQPHGQNNNQDPIEKNY